MERHRYEANDVLDDSRAILDHGSKDSEEKKMDFEVPVGSAMPASAIPCRSCKVKEGTLFCPCRSAKYCSKNCQKEDWGRHKLDCFAIRREPPSKEPRSRPEGLPEYMSNFNLDKNNIPHVTTGPFGRVNFTVEEGKMMSMMMVGMAKDCAERGLGGGTFFHSACASGYLDAVKEILELKLPGVHVDGGNGEPEYRSVLSGACKHGHNDVAEFLLENGANPNIKDCEGCTALHWCAYDDQVETSRLLVRYGADVNEPADSLATPLHCAASVGKVEIARFLLENGANTKAKDRKGWTPLDRARVWKHQEIIDLLVEFEATSV